MFPSYLNTLVQYQQQQTTQNPLASVYQKVAELASVNKAKSDQNKNKQFRKIIVQVPKTNFKLGIDRGDQFIQKRIEGFGSKQFMDTYNISRDRKQNRSKFTSFPAVDSMKNRSKSERLINFLKVNNETKIKKEQIEIPEFVKNDSVKERQRDIFTPIRPVSKMSIMDSVSGTSRSNVTRSANKSSGGYSQAARLSQGGSNKSSTPGQYLRKGHRMRQVLKKQLQNPNGIEEEQGQLAYLKEYDQWVPASFINYKKMELEHFMNILVGKKKMQKNVHIFQPVYL